VLSKTDAEIFRLVRKLPTDQPYQNESWSELQFASPRVAISPKQEFNYFITVRPHVPKHAVTSKLNLTRWSIPAEKQVTGRRCWLIAKEMPCEKSIESEVEGPLLESKSEFVDISDNEKASQSDSLDDDAKRLYSVVTYDGQILNFPIVKPLVSRKHVSA
jgi:hypothetical protein